jgi:hypothetical protein
MRSAIATIFVAAGVATAAVAQTPPPAAPAAPTAPAATAPAPMAPAAPPAAPAPDAAVPAAPAAPAAPATPEAAPAPPEPTLPTAGDGYEVAQVLTSVCVPLVKGGNWEQLAQAAGMKKVRKNGVITYAKMLGADKAYSISLESPGSNKDVCSLTLNYAINGEKPIISALNVWSYLHDPYMPVQRNDFTPPTDYKRITNSWEYYDEHVSDGLVFVQLKKPDGSPVSAKADLATLLYSERHF